MNVSELSLTRMPQTILISNAVGTIRNSTADRMKVIPLQSCSISIQLQTDSLRVDLLCSTVNRARQASRLPRKVKFKIEIEQVLERLARDLPDGTLTHIRENGVK